jgi:hypothetical protein
MKARLSGFIFAMILTGCSIGYYGDTVGEDVKRFRVLEEYYNELESDYILILENLTISPKDEMLLREKDLKANEMLKVRESLDIARQQKEMALQGLEDAVVRKQTEVLFEDSVKVDVKKRLEKQLKKHDVHINLMD